MPRHQYLVTVPIEEVNGRQEWAVQADSQEEAIAKVLDGKAELIAEEMEVTKVGAPKVELDE